MEHTNEMQLIFDSRSSNESFARVTVAAFMTSLNPTVEEVSDVKTAVSEAVTNAIIHGYENEVHSICIRCRTEGKTLYLEIEDTGKGIEDVKQAMEAASQRAIKKPVATVVIANPHEEIIKLVKKSASRLTNLATAWQDEME